MFNQRGAQRGVSCGSSAYDRSTSIAKCALHSRYERATRYGTAGRLLLLPKRFLFPVSVFEESLEEQPLVEVLNTLSAVHADRLSLHHLAGRDCSHW